MTATTDKFARSAYDALSDIPDGASIQVSGFGLSGQPSHLLDVLLDLGARDLTIICNNAGTGDTGLAALIAAGHVRHLIASYPRGAHSHAFDEAFAAGKLTYECVPQGTLAERIRAAGAGIGGFFTPTSFGTELAAGKETRMIAGRGHVFEKPLPADFALVRGDRSDQLGNVVYRKAGRNFGPLMCAASTTTIVSVPRRADIGELDPEHVVTPGIFVDRVVVDEPGQGRN
ncbi:3-oxoadipate CoA-transferase [Rhodococcus sp. KBW08]|uniref:3-oxoacid CoA-transferase subunit A n=1 Tax=Rhodococcus sp. KBW08 TaxID=2144188 RepID=UPI000F5B2737|nr:3-oxoacid CoA-transferase subunit A [Rhodococcus sp. KBW08]RQO46030.1 3-oxoadipate CoA-transferase [Rhodococcus sp. KBW08]